MRSGPIERRFRKRLKAILDAMTNQHANDAFEWVNNGASLTSAVYRQRYLRVQADAIEAITQEAVKLNADLRKFGKPLAPGDQRLENLISEQVIKRAKPQGGVQ